MLEYYTLAPTALTFRSTEPLAEFQEVKVNGQVVDPSNYTLEEGSTIVTLSIDYLKTLSVGDYNIEVVSANNAPSGGFTVAAPELNEYGFYYNQPYSAYVDYFQADTVFFIREDGTIDVLVGDAIETCPYTINGNGMTVTTSAMGDVHLTISTDGIECIELATNFVLGDEFAAADEDYIYIYKEDLGGYEVTAIDKTKAEYGAIKTGINGIDTVKLADRAFYNSVNLVTCPQIPSSVTAIGMEAFWGGDKLESITIPDSVITIRGDAFNYCRNLTSVKIPASVASFDDYIFLGCTSLTNIEVSPANTSYCSIDGALYSKNMKRLIKHSPKHPSTSFIIPSGVEYISSYACEACYNLTSVTIPDSIESMGVFGFDNCENLTSITYQGSKSNCSYLISHNSSNNWIGVPATYIQCSDGQVSLV